MAKQAMHHPAIPQFEPAMFHDAMELGRKRLEAIAELQKEVFSLFEETNHHWMKRLKQEADLTKQLSGDLSACKSVPEMVSTYQNWLSHHMKLIATDGQSLMADSQKLVETSARMMSGNGGSLLNKN